MSVSAWTGSWPQCTIKVRGSLILILIHFSDPCLSVPRRSSEQKIAKGAKDFVGRMMDDTWLLIEALGGLQRKRASD